MSHNAVVRGFGSTALKYPLSGLVYCGECRGNCYSLPGGITKQHGRNYYFQCKNARLSSCSSRRAIRQELCETAAIEAIQARALQAAESILECSEQDEPVELKQLRGQLLQLQQIPGNNQAIAQALLQTQQQIRDAEVQLATQDWRSAELRWLETNLAEEVAKPGFWEELTLEQKQGLFRELVERVIVRESEVVEVRLRV